MKSFFDTVFHRASVRSFNSDPISDAEWDTLLKSAMAAPSAVNKQPWDFIVIDDRRTLDALAAELPYAKMATEAPAAVVVCAVPARANEGKLDMRSSMPRSPARTSRRSRCPRARRRLDRALSAVRSRERSPPRSWDSRRCGSTRFCSDRKAPRRDESEGQIPSRANP